MSKLTTSQRGLDLIKSFEKFAPNLYLCPAGKPTIGYGHVLRPSEKFNKISLPQADQLLRNDCGIVEIYLNAIFPHPSPLPEGEGKKVCLNQNEFDALVSLVFNIGLGNFEKSTLLKRLRDGDKPRAAAEFLRWDKINQGGELVMSKGLHRRRCVERELFIEVPE